LFKKIVDIEGCILYIKNIINNNKTKRANMLEDIDQYYWELKSIELDLFSKFRISVKAEELSESVFDEIIEEYAEDLRADIEDYNGDVTRPKPRWNVPELIELKEEYLEVIKQ
jgi:restriction endonuclease